MNDNYQEAFNLVSEYILIGNELPPSDFSVSGSSYTSEEIYENQLKRKKYDISTKLKSLLSDRTADITDEIIERCAKMCEEKRLERS